jgi:acetate kinase
MVAGGRLRILTINAGSSSLKAALYDMERRSAS